MTSPIRDILFGDASLDQWPREDGDVVGQEPWASFVRARDAMADGRTDDAVAIWRNVLEIPELEPRHYLQVWHFLRAQGVRPSDDQAKELLGIVLEVPVESGFDLLAAYADRSARYFNYSGASIVWEHPDPSLDPLIDAFLAAGRPLMETLTPWDGERPAPPEGSDARVSFLTPAGVLFSEGPFKLLADDPVGRPIVQTGYRLMKELIMRTTGQRR